MGIQIYFIVALGLIGLVVTAIVLYFASSAIWSHRWQDRERHVQG